LESAVDELIQEFLIESNENLDRFDADLVKLEADPGSETLLSSIFRSIHSIKGACGFLGFQKLEALAHVGENLLSKLRDGQLKLTSEISTALLQTGDSIRTMLGQIESTGTDGAEEFRELIEELRRLLESGDREPNGALTEANVVVAGATPPAPSVEANDPETSEPTHEGAAIKAAQPDQAVGAAEMDAAPVSRSPRPSFAEAAMPQISEDTEVAPRAVAERPRPGASQAAESGDGRAAEEGGGKTAQDSTIRVNVALLDRLMNLVGELVLARNQLLQFSNDIADSGFQTISQHMNLIATELQEEVMRTRMQPIGNIWSKFPRTVRDLVVSCGKDVRIYMEGKETELDKTIIEAIKDPLTHLVRNSVDHGIELPEVRRQAGKDPAGTLTLRAFHEGGQVNIEISDDGAGLNVERIRKKAMEKGLVSAEQAARMEEREIFNLIFLPGFSTAEKVTNVSGRGVGMDVVRTNIERIGGTVDVQSRAGQGTTIRVKIPLTLAIIPALVVTCQKNRFAIPQVALTELVSLDAGDTSKGGIEMVHGAPVYRLRGQLLPLLYLNRELRLTEEGPEKAATGNVNIVVLRADDRQFGLVVDEINDTEEIVVKPLRKQLKTLKTFAGASIMGDGRVALILDVLGLAQRANLVSQTREAAAKQEAAAAQQTANGQQTLLLFQAGSGGRMAIPLSSVARLEEFQRGVIERAGDREVVQYRGQILPLIRVTEAVGQYAAEGDGSEPLQVVVYTERNRSVGLVVGQILDIVEEKFTVERPEGRSGLLGSAVVQQRVTDLLDVAGVVRAAYPDFFEHTVGA
jgi:two-component system chemotaxis sensor kinase CheA